MRAMRYALRYALLLLALAPALADEARLHNTAAQAYLWDKKEKQAFDEFVLSLRADPNQAMPHFQIGRIFEKQGQFAEALKQYQEALAIDPTFPGAEDGIKRLGYLVAPRPTGAADAAAADVLSEGDYARQLATAREMAALRRFGEAEKVVVALIAKRPDDVALRMLHAQVLEGQGKLIDALRAYRAAQAKLPQNVQLQLAIAKLLYAQGEFRVALGEAKIAMQLDPKNPAVFRMIGEILLSADKKAEAYQYLAEAARLNPGDALSKFRSEALVKELGLRHYNNGMYYWQTGQWRLAVTELEAALKSEFMKLGEEDRSRLQSALIDSRFMLEEVGKKIAAIQKERADREFGVVDKRLSFEEVIRQPTFWKEGRTVDFRGWVVSREDTAVGSEVVVSTDRNDLFTTNETSDVGRRRDSVEVLSGFAGAGGPGGNTRVGGFGFRANSDMTRWFLFRTPKPLPSDDRIRANSTVRVIGKLAQPQFLQNKYNRTFSRFAQPVVAATMVDFRRESSVTEPVFAGAGQTGQGAGRGRGAFDTSAFPVQSDINTPPGIAGALRIDYLTAEEPLTARPLPAASPGLPALPPPSSIGIPGGPLVAPAGLPPLPDPAPRPGGPAIQTPVAPYDPDARANRRGIDIDQAPR